MTGISVNPQRKNVLRVSFLHGIANNLHDAGFPGNGKT